MDRSSTQKISKKIEVLNDTLEQMDLIDIYRTLHLKAAQYTFFSSAHGTFSRMDHMLDHKNSLRKFKKIKIISSISSDHNAVRLEINYKKEKKPCRSFSIYLCVLLHLIYISEMLRLA